LIFATGFILGAMLGAFVGVMAIALLRAGRTYDNGRPEEAMRPTEASKLIAARFPLDRTAPAHAHDRTASRAAPDAS
jgi:hypothetical protein